MIWTWFGTHPNVAVDARYCSCVVARLPPLCVWLDAMCLRAHATATDSAQVACTCVKHASVLLLCAAEVIEYTWVARTAQASRDLWLERATCVADVSKVSLLSLRAAIGERDTRSTVDDVETDHPYGANEEGAGPEANDDSDPVDAVGDGEEDLDGEGAEDFDMDIGEAGAGDADGVDMAAAVDGVERMLANLRADDMESVVARELYSGPAAGPMADTAPAHTAEPDPYEPTGGCALVLTVEGRTMDVPLSHRASLAVLGCRKYHLHLLTEHPDTGVTVVPYGPNNNVPSSTPEFEVDLASLAHDPGCNIEAMVRTVLEGVLPEIVARFRHLAKDVQVALSETGMCLVRGCWNRASRQSDVVKALHLCADHVGADLEVKATGDLMRRCTGCHTMLDVREFRASVGGETVGTVCARCRTTRRNNNKKKKAPNEVQLEALPAHLAVPAAEVEAGRDEGGAYVRERRLAAQRLDAAGAASAGSSLSNPYLVHAMFSAQRRVNKNQCTRVGCPNPNRGRDGATLCFTCATVRSASSLCIMPGPHVRWWPCTHACCGGRGPRFASRCCAIPVEGPGRRQHDHLLCDMLRAPCQTVVSYGGGRKRRASVQRVPGGHVALVRVTAQNGDATGDVMYIRYCGDCYRGYPLHLFLSGHACCKRCTMRQRGRQAPAVRVPSPVDKRVERWATPEAALILNQDRRQGLCCADGCVQPVQRRGEMRAANNGTLQRAYPLCSDHMKVRPEAMQLSAAL